MSLAEKKPIAGRAIPSLLGEVRRKIRAYVAVEGLGATVAVAGLGLWLALALDWLFEPSRSVRLMLLAVVGLVTLVVFARRFLGRVFARLPNRTVALIVERRYRQLNESLLTAVELDPASLSEPGRAMLADTRRQAERLSASADVSGLFNKRPRNRAVGAALLAAATIGGFALAAPGLFDLGYRRLTAQTDEAWPRRTHLSIVGFESGETVVAQGGDVELIVRADAAKNIPSEVYIRYRTDDGVRDEQIMEREGEARPNVDPFQQYKLQFRGLSSSMDFEVRGGDARIRKLRVRVVERPQVKLRLACKYPPYTGRADGEIDVTGSVPLPQGTIVAATATANKPLRSVVVNVPDGNGGTKETRLDLMREGGGSSQFQFEVGRLMSDTVVVLQLYDVDGLENQSLLTLLPTVDNPPTVAVQRRGLEPVVTPQAQVLFAGRVNDDYGVAKMWFDFSLEGTQPQQRPFSAKTAQVREADVSDVIELPEAFSGAPLVPGQVLSIAVRAVDNRALPGIEGGNLASGDVATLTVVTDAELLRLLEAREIMFREQFKALIDKVTRSRDGLVGVGEAPAKNDEVESDSESLPVNRDVVLLDQTRTRAKEQRAETLLVANGFAEIVAELVRNRAADSARLQERLADDIAEPLQRIADVSFAEYEARLTKLHAAVSRASVDKAETADLRRDVLQSADAILVQMNVVLEKMQELESFKEAVDLLKSIIAMQKEIGERTKKSRGDKTRLLD
jgi:hypothetical protein